MPKKNHIPIRSCIWCRKKVPKSELIRLSLVDGKALKDKNKKQIGRGAYVCYRLECLARVSRNERRCLDRAFKAKVKSWDLADLTDRI